MILVTNSTGPAPGSAVVVGRAAVAHSRRGRRGTSMPHFTMLRAAGAAAAALAVTGLAVAPQAQAAVPRATIGGARPAWAVTSDQVGPAVTGSLGARVYLAGRDPAGLVRLRGGGVHPGQPALPPLPHPGPGPRAVRGQQPGDRRGQSLADRGGAAGHQGSRQRAGRSVRGRARLAGRSRAGLRGVLRPVPGPGRPTYRAPAQTPSVPASLSGRSSRSPAWTPPRTWPPRGTSAPPPPRGASPRARRARRTSGRRRRTTCRGPTAGTGPWSSAGTCRSSSATPTGSPARE